MAEERTSGGEENSGKLRGPPGRGERKEARSGRGVSAPKSRKAGVAWARGKRQSAGQIKMPTVRGIWSGREALPPLLNCDEGGRWRITGSGVGGRARPAFQPSTPKGAYCQTATHMCPLPRRMAGNLTYFLHVFVKAFALHQAPSSYQLLNGGHGGSERTGVTSERSRVERRESGVRLPGHARGFIKAERARGRCPATNEKRASSSRPALRAPGPGSWGPKELNCSTCRGGCGSAGPSCKLGLVLDRRAPRRHGRRPLRLPRLRTPRKPEGLRADPARLSRAR